MEAAALFASTAGLPLPAAAARLAAAGVPVFPCVPAGKRPLTRHGFYDASIDVGRVVAWWRHWPEANIGLPTGSASGVDVVDVDQKAAGSGFAAFDRARRAGLVPDWLALVRTPSGGLHAYFPVDPARPQASWQAARAHVDFRGVGGYVVVPPSVVALDDGAFGQYAAIGGPQPHPSPVDAAALRDFLAPRSEPSFPRNHTAEAADAKRLAGWVAALAAGERNRGLFWAACRLAESGVGPAAALDVLGPAGEHAGLPPREVFTTVRSAYRATSAVPAPAAAATAGHGGAARRMARSESRVLS